ncbi:DUF4352 domain-containing protein [Neobacillus vireti]|uniref:DUF4352 domain-containing protein n=1 Tax=Neobacillus vireti TaxID=220686 RepID=UPI002FFF3BED
MKKVLIIIGMLLIGAGIGWVKDQITKPKLDSTEELTKAIQNRQKAEAEKSKSMEVTVQKAEADKPAAAKAPVQLVDPLKVEVLQSSLRPSDGDESKLVVQVSVTNLTDSAVHLNPAYFSIVINGQTFSQTGRALDSLKDQFPWVDLQPGTKSIGYVGFEVPAVDRYQLLVENSSIQNVGSQYTAYDKVDFSTTSNSAAAGSNSTAAQPKGQSVVVNFPEETIDSVLNNPNKNNITEIVIAENTLGVSLTGLSTLPQLTTLRIYDIKQISNIKEIINSKTLKTIYVGNDSSEGDMEYFLRQHGLSNNVDVVYSDGVKNDFKRK